MPDRVVILLSTRDGAAFLQAQLDSIAAQTLTNWLLLWRDDGSVDNTSELLHAFARGPGQGRCIAVPHPGGHLGIARSFLTLLGQAPADSIVAFADQDDVWLPDKLARGVAALGAADPGRPTLYCARQRLVDEDLAPLGLSPYRGDPPPFPAGLTQNVATGCTVMLDPRAVALITATEPPDGTLHDWWSYLLVSAAGGTLIADPVPVVLYRQHRGNAVGAPHSAVRRGVMALRRGPDAFMGLFQRHVAGLLASRQLLSAEATRDLKRLDRALNGRLRIRLITLWKIRHLVRQTRLETVLFRLWFLIG